MPTSCPQTLSVLVQRSRHGLHRAYVRVGGVEAGYRDLTTGDVHCSNEAHREVLTWATAGMIPTAARVRVASPATYDLAELRSIRTLAPAAASSRIAS